MRDSENMLWGYMGIEINSGAGPWSWDYEIPARSWWMGRVWTAADIKGRRGWGKGMSTSV